MNMALDGYTVNHTQTLRFAKWLKFSPLFLVEYNPECHQSLLLARLNHLFVSIVFLCHVYSQQSDFVSTTLYLFSITLYIFSVRKAQLSTSFPIQTRQKTGVNVRINSKKVSQ